MITLIHSLTERFNLILLLLPILSCSVYVGIYIIHVIRDYRSIYSLHKGKWEPLRLINKQSISRNTAIYLFALKDKEEVLDIPLGHHVQVRVYIDEEERIRYYTPINLKKLKGTFELMIKTYENGTVSKYFNTLKVGDMVDFRGPFGDLNYQYNNPVLNRILQRYNSLINDTNVVSQLGIVAGGSGITPVLQVLNEIVTDPFNLSKISLIYANETEDDILLKRELDDMSKRYPHFQIHYVLHHPPKGWNGTSGYVTKEIMAKYLPKSDKNHKLLVCGPLEMNELVLKYGKELGWNNGFQKSKSNDKVFVF